MTNNKFLILSFLMLISTKQIISQSSPTHNIRGLFGDRASGMGGAFTAVSDDPSGTFYNPAGLAFIPSVGVTSSVISANNDKQTFENFPSYGSSYNGKSRGITSGFIGTVRSLDKWKIGFSIASPNTSSIDQYTTSYNSSLTGSGSARLQLSQSFSTTYIGPSLAYSISEKFSVGTTVYGFFENFRSSQGLLLSSSSNTYINQRTESLRDSRGVLPVFGFQFMPSTKLSFGLSFRRPFSLSGSERNFTQLTGSNTTASGINFEDSSNVRYGAIIGNAAVLGIPINQSLLLGGNAQVRGRVPEPTEVRFGTAWFASRNLLISADAIYTGSYQYKKLLYNYEPFNKILVLADNRVRSLDIEEVWNFAMGLEYYVFEFLAIRVGYYTNNSNTKNVSWLKSAAKTSFSSFAQVAAQNSGSAVIVSLNDLKPSSDRNEYINLRGISFGLSYETSRSILSLTYINESGRGSAQPVSNLLPATFRSYEDRLYLGATIKQQ